MKTPLGVATAGLALTLLAGCSQQPQPPPVDLMPLSQAMRFVGICSVICSAVWGTSICVLATIRRDERQRGQRQQHQPRRRGPTNHNPKTNNNNTNNRKRRKQTS